MTAKMWSLFFAHVFLSVALATSDRKDEKIFLTDIRHITLRQGLLTNYRRERPVLQLRCTGGTALCKAYIPEVVYCYNKGSNAYGVQWECKSDMDNLYRLGTVQVTCEGYAHSRDPFVLKDSCGLIYTIDLRTEENQNQGFFQRIWFSAKSGVSNIFVAIGLCAFFFLLLRHYFRNSASSNNLNADMDDFVDELDPPINIEEDIWSDTDNSNDEPRIDFPASAKKTRQVPAYSNGGAKKKSSPRLVDDRKEECSETEIAGAMTSAAIAGCYLGSSLFGNKTQEDNLRFRYPNFAQENTHHSYDHPINRGLFAQENTHHSYDNPFNSGSFGGEFGFDNYAGNMFGTDIRATSAFGGTTLR